jgi:N-carbamoylputrescine amidase
MTTKNFTIGLVQMGFGTNPDENTRRAVEKVGEAASQGAQVICLPEMYRTPYFCQHEDFAMFDLAEPVPGPSSTAFAKAAKEHNVAVIVPIFEKRAPGLYHNSALIYDTDGSLLGIYRKMHIPDDPAFYEKYYFTPGDLGFKAFTTRHGRISTLICWDQWYPEGARLSALHGAAVLFYPTAIGWHPDERERYGTAQHDAWRTIQRSHAIANGTYVGSVNRIGHEIQRDGDKGLLFWGQSFICDPQGVILAEGSIDQEEILIAEIDMRHLETIRRNWPFLRDRRIDAYSDITKRFIDE